MFVRVVEHDARWEAEFRAEAERLAEVIGEGVINIFHIGSTAIKGLKAKPVIDIMPVVDDICALDPLAGRFEALGYEVMGEFGLPGRRYYRKGGDNRTHQIHAFQFDNMQAIERHLCFRDYLRARPDVCAEYGRLKAALALEFPEDIDGYADGKDDFVRATELAAIKWHFARIF